MSISKNRVFSILFLLIISVFCIADIISLGCFYVENRKDLNDWTPDLGRKIEVDIISNFLFKNTFVDFNGYLKNAIGQKEMNRITKLQNGYLSNPVKGVGNNELDFEAKNVAALEKILSGKGIKLLYCILPYEISKYDRQLPDGIHEGMNDSLDYFNQKLNEYGVNYIDFRDSMHSDGIDQYTMWYRTDHHWNMHGGFYAFQKILDNLESRLDVKFEEKLKNKDSYDIKIWKEWHLGSRGQRTGRFFAGIDDFELYVPKFPTKIRKKYHAPGDINSVVYNYEQLKNPNYASKYTYDSVLGGSLSNFENLLATNDKKILFISDSMGQAVAPFLIMSFGRFYCSEPGLINDEFIEEIKPDAVVIMWYCKNGYRNYFEYPITREHNIVINE